MKHASKWSLLALSTFAASPALATLAETSRSFAEKEIAASRADDSSVREDLEAERDLLANAWCDEVTVYVKEKSDHGEPAMARLVAADGLSVIRNHPALGVCSARLETLLSEAIHRELELMDSDGKSGRVLLAVSRGLSLLATRPGDAEVQARVVQWQDLQKRMAHETIEQAQRASLPGAELLARRFAAHAGDQTPSKELEAQVAVRTSRSPQYAMPGQPCGLLQGPRLPAATGAPLVIAIQIEQCDEQTKEHQTTDVYQYTEQVPYVREATVGEDCQMQKQRSFGKSDVTGKNEWIEKYERVCTPRQGFKTEYKTEYKTGERLVTHRVTSMAVRGVLVIPETGERLPFSAQDSYDDQQYTSPQGSRAFTNEGREHITQAANTAVAQVVNAALAREKTRLAALETQRAQAAFQAQNWLELEDALVLATRGGATPASPWLTALAERHHVTPEQMSQLLQGYAVTTELPRSAEPIAQIPEVEWTPEKERLTNDRATEHFMFAHLSLLYGRPKHGDETGRYGIALGATLHSPVNDPLAFSMMTSFRLGVDQDPRILYDLQVGLGAGSRLGPACLQVHGIGGFDRIAMSDHYELPSAWTYGGEGALSLELTRYKSIGLDGVLQRRTSGPDDGRTEKRLRLRFVFLGDDLSGFSFGGSVEDYGVGRVYGLFVGSD